ncbi:MAG: hypothetical protein ACK5P7_04055 [Bdellovibrio sp.]|jgi:hypothetical protein
MNRSVVQKSVITRWAVSLSVIIGMSTGFYGPQLWGQGQLRIVKADLVASTGSCVGGLSESQARQVLAENNITFPGAKSEEIVALGKAVQQINAMSGDRTPQIRGTRVEFNNRMAYSRQKSTNPPVIEICRNGHPHLGNVGLLAHEFGHLVGNQNNARMYSQYKSRINPRCCLTKYSCENRNPQPRNEEFAEVFAAFIANPSVAENAGGSCAAALSFFKGAFKNGAQAGCGSSPTILANSASDAPIRSYTDVPQLDPVQTSVSAAGRTSGSAFTVGPWMAMIGPLAAMALPMLMAKQKPAAAPALPVAAPMPAPQIAPVAPAGSLVPTGTR